jgi:signal transduction histidine kinase
MNLSVTENINILIVDDSRENVLVLEQSLERKEINILTTTSPSCALQLCSANDIDIALIDVHMPQMDGFELLDMIKRNPLTQHIMVVLITGYSMNSADVVKGLSKGAIDYLFKPLDLYITIAKVDSLITQVNYQREIKRKNIELENSRQELVKAVETAEKSRTVKENFLANMSHEIRTPLNSISGLTYLLKESNLSNDQMEIIKLMEYSSKSLLGIVDDILESSKLDAGKIKIVRSKTNIIELVTTICNLIRPLATEKGLILKCEIDKEVPEFVMADSLRLNQILMNLINNSIKFTPSGNITVFLSVADKKHDSASLEFIVKDTGLGIPPESLKKIFNRFEQIEDKSWQKFGGTGLGLSIVKSLAELKGGTLDVESIVNEGTEFTFRNWFAIADYNGEPQDRVQENPLALSQFNDTVILLAEDNAINQFLVVQMLKKWGIKVDVAFNGLEAFEKLKYNHYDLVLMDTHMPVLDGVETTRKIRQEMPDYKRHVPIISFSASVIENEKIEASKAGVNDFIGKPFEPSILHAKITQLLIKRSDK